MPEEGAFICPFCGAPYRILIPAGVVQVKCQYCRSTVLVPPRLGGTVQRCPNHPDVLAIGLCNDCNKSYCDRCLYIHKVRDGKLHVCSECHENRQSMKIVGGFLGLMLVFIVVILFLMMEPLFGIFSLTLFIVIILMALYDFSKKPLTVHDSKQTSND